MSNTPNYDVYAALAAKLGKDAGVGKNTQVQFLLGLVEGAHLGALSLDKDDSGSDDADRLTEIYVRSQNAAVIFDKNAQNQRVQTSKHRTAIKFGQWSKGGNGQPLGIMNDTMTIWRKLRDDKGTSKKIDDAATTLLKLARTQMKRDQLLDDAELRGLCMKKQHDLPTLEEYIASMRKGLYRLAKGKAASGTLMDDSPAIGEAITALDRRIKQLAKVRSEINTNAAVAQYTAGI